MSTDTQIIAKMLDTVLHTDRVRFGVETALVGAAVAMSLSLLSSGWAVILSVAGATLLAFASGACLLRLSISGYLLALAHTGERGLQDLPKVTRYGFVLTTQGVWAGLLGGELLTFAIGLLSLLAGVATELCQRMDSNWPAISALASVVLGSVCVGVFLIRRDSGTNK